VPGRLNADDFYPQEERHEAGKESASPGTSRQQSAQECSPLMHRLSLSQMTTKKWSFEDDLDAVQKLGLRHIGLWRWKYEEMSEQTTADLLEKYQLKPSSISWVGGFTGTNGYLLEDALAEAEEVIRFASWIGARNVVVSTGEQGRHIHSHALRLAVESLKYLGDYAAEYGIELAVMPMSASAAYGWTFLTSLRKCRELIEECDHPYVGVCLHSYYALQERHWKSELRNLLPDVKLVRLCDGQSSAKPRRQCLPYSGKMNLTGWLDFLETNGYRDIYEIDTWCDEVWQSDHIEPFQRSLEALNAHFPTFRDEG